MTKQTRVKDAELNCNFSWIIVRRISFFFSNLNQAGVSAKHVCNECPNNTINHATLLFSSMQQRHSVSRLAALFGSHTATNEDYRKKINCSGGMSLKLFHCTSACMLAHIFLNKNFFLLLKKRKELVFQVNCHARDKVII